MDFSLVYRVILKEINDLNLIYQIDDKVQNNNIYEGKKDMKNLHVHSV